MYEIHPADCTETENLFNENNLKFDENAKAVILRDGEERKGFALYTLIKHDMWVKKIEPEKDVPIFDGLLRACLHVGLNHGACVAYYEDTMPYDVLCKLKFVEDEQKKTLNVKKLYSSCCNCE